MLSRGCQYSLQFALIDEQKNEDKSSREIDILKKLNSSWCIPMLACFFSKSSEGLWQNMVFPFYSTSLESLIESKSLNISQSGDIFVSVTIIFC